MAAARKVIVLDFNAISADLVWALAAVVLATSIGYWMVGLATAGGIGFGSHRRSQNSEAES